MILKRIDAPTSIHGPAPDGTIMNTAGCKHYSRRLFRAEAGCRKAYLQRLRRFRECQRRRRWLNQRLRMVPLDSRTGRAR